MKKSMLMAGMMAVAVALAGCGASESSSQSGKADAIKVTLITMDSNDLHWVSVDKGAKKAAEEFGVDYKWMAPDKKDDAQQIERINNAIADNTNAIVIAANGPDSISSALDEAKAEGIKIVYVDSPAKPEAEATFATDNYNAGSIAAEEMIKKLEEKGITAGKIGIINFSTSSNSGVQRETGFRDKMKESAFELLETQYSDGDASRSQDMADNYITEGCVGIFAVNEGCTVGTGNAIQGASAQDLVVGVGFDQSDAILSLVKDGALYCTMAQNPETMGYEGVKAAVAAIKGENIPNKEVDTGVSVIKKEDIK